MRDFQSVDKLLLIKKLQCNWLLKCIDEKTSDLSQGLKIYSNEFDNIRSILAGNGYSDHVVNSSITRKIQNFRRPPSYGPKKCLFIYIFHGWVLFRRGSKSKSLHQFNAVISLWSLAPFLRLDDICPQAKKICFLLLNRAISFMNLRATVTVGTWVAHLNACRTESCNTFSNL